MFSDTPDCLMQSSVQRLATLRYAAFQAARLTGRTEASPEEKLIGYIRASEVREPSRA